MKERPILFSAPMVRAILEGRKTMTRRVIKPQPSAGVRWGFAGWEDGHGKALSCPYGQPSDRLWVRETFAEGYSTKSGIAYRATDKWDDCEEGTPENFKEIKWRPSIFMPRWASRILLEVTDIRVERVQDISDEDSKAEGAAPIGFGDLKQAPMSLIGGIGSVVYNSSYRYGFFDLWDSINTKRGYGWDANPWVWVVSFKRIEASA